MQGGALIRQARRDMEVIGFDTETGLLLESQGALKNSAEHKVIENNIDSSVKVKKRVSDVNLSAPEELAADIDMELARIQTEGKHWVSFFLHI